MVELGFYALTALAVMMVLTLLRNHPNPKNIILRYFMVVLAWATYLIIVSSAGLLNDFGLPPRIPLLVVIPAVIIIVILTGRPGMQKVIQNTPLYLPVFLQSFRVLVELLIYATFLEGIFPRRATFEGLNFDILVGVSAMFIGFAAYKGAVGAKGLMIWNVLSLCVLSLTVYSFVSSYYFTDYPLTDNSRRFIEFPYLLLASNLLPIAVLLHVFSIRQLLYEWKQTGKGSIRNASIGQGA